MRIILAPMEGVVDYPMRRLQAAVGGPDQMVSEFIRVTDQLLPRRVFHKSVPELAQAECAQGTIPLVIQLLGSNPEAVALNACRAIELGAPAIDLNFGCPAKTVNKSRGGAIMLEDPQSVYAVVQAVRATVPQQYPVSAKMRLGYQDKSLALENACAIESAGASYLTVHARTKVEGYKPPAHWEWIARIREAVAVPVIANGEVWTPEDYWRCREISGCEDVMIGRGLIANPFLVEQIRNPQAPRDTATNWQRLQPFLLSFAEEVALQQSERHFGGRIKQWLTMLGWHYPQAQTLFARLRTEKTAAQILPLIRAEARSASATLCAPA